MPEPTPGEYDVAQLDGRRLGALARQVSDATEEVSRDPVNDPDDRIATHLRGVEVPARPIRPDRQGPPDPFDIVRVGIESFGNVAGNVSSLEGGCTLSQNATG